MSDGIPPPRALLATFGPLARPAGGLALRASSVVRALSALGMETTVISVGEPTDIDHHALGGFTRLQPVRPGHWALVSELPRAVGSALPADLVLVESALLLPGVLAARPRAP